MVLQGIRASIAKKPYTFVIFQGGGSPDPLSPSGSAHGMDAGHATQICTTDSFSQVSAAHFQFYAEIRNIKVEFIVDTP